MRKIYFLGLILLILISPAWAKVWLNPSVTSQGKTFGVYLDNPDIVAAKAFFLKQDYPLFISKELNSTWRALIPIPLDLKSGQYPVKVMAIKEEKTINYEGEIKVTKGDFEKVNFNLPTSKKKLFRRTTIVDEWSEIEQALLQDHPFQAWEGNFEKPCPGITTMDFGSFELIDQKHQGRHRGMDIYNAKEESADIKSANNGEVAIAKEFTTFGKTVVINHGQRVFSLYFHLSSLYVKKGDQVAKGDVIGKMGTTGISTAPHLHFALSVNNQRVDPTQWLSQDF